MSSMTHDWERTRSDFNHGWLKNQFIAVLLRCRRVSVGSVEDPNVGEDLTGRLVQWSARRCAAEAILLEVERMLDRAVDDGVASDSPWARLVREGNEAERLQWMQRERPEVAVEAARRAVSELDSEVADALVRMTEMPERSGRPADTETIDRLLATAGRLAEAFSRLSLCRWVEEPA